MLYDLDFKLVFALSDYFALLCVLDFSLISSYVLVYVRTIFISVLVTPKMRNIQSQVYNWVSYHALN